MKKLLVLLFSLLISFNSYGKTFCLETDLIKNKDGLIYSKDFEFSSDIKPFSGKFLCKDENGEDKWKGSINNGKRDGKWTTWHYNGKKRSEDNWDNGIRVGKTKFWHDNGQKEYEGMFKRGEFDGNWIWWDENGQIEVEVEFKDGECISEDC